MYQSAKMFGRHFDEKDELISHITRASIDVLKVTPLLASLDWAFRSHIMIDYIQSGRLYGRMEIDSGTKACKCPSPSSLDSPYSITEIGNSMKGWDSNSESTSFQSHSLDNNSTM